MNESMPELDQMLADGLIDEVKTLKKWAIIKEWCPCRDWDIKKSLSYLDGTWSLEEAICIKTGYQTFCQAADHLV